jgi:hypothetical protein
VRETICDASQDTAYVTVSESIIYQCLFMMLKLYLAFSLQVTPNERFAF